MQILFWILYIFYLLSDAEINTPYFIVGKQCRGTNKVQILQNKVLQKHHLLSVRSFGKIASFSREHLT